MKVVILYRPVSEHATAVESFMRDFKKRNPGISLETINVDARDGVALASLYDIMRYPAILALSDDGTLLHLWNDDSLPMMDEVASYVFAS